MSATVEYFATMVDAATGSHQDYTFEAAADLFDRPRAELIAAFMHYVDHTELPKEDVGYEVQAAFKDREHKVVTAIGVLRLASGELPFMAMIGPKQAAL